MSQQPARTGLVFIRGDRNFAGDTEITPDIIQLPQFLPRTVWPSDEVASHLQRQTKPLSANVDIYRAAEVTALRERFAAIYRSVEPMSPFVDGIYDGCSWDMHAALMHDILHRSLQNDLRFTKAEMMALCRTLSYGMHDSMTFLNPWTLHSQPGDGRRPDTITEEWVPEFHMRMKSGEFLDPVATRHGYICRLHGRRYIVVPVLSGGYQWSMTVFDRVCGHLYVFDAGHGEARDERIDGCIHLWVRFWNFMLQPWNFQYFVPSVTTQPCGKDSGAIGMIWLMNVLRNQVGTRMASQDPDVEVSNMTITEAQETGPNEETALCLRDWVPDGCGLSRASLQAVRRILRVMICNELGLKNHEVMTKEFRNYGNRTPRYLPSAKTLIDKVNAELVGRNSAIPGGLFWTAQGGPQFAMAQRTTPGTFDAGAERRHRPGGLGGNFRLETAPAVLTRRTDQNTHWAAGVPFTENTPVDRPAYGVELRAARIRALPGPEGSAVHRYGVDLLNLEAPSPFQLLRQHQVIEIDRVASYFDADGAQFLCLTLHVGFLGSWERKHVDVNIPIPTPQPYESTSSNSSTASTIILPPIL